MNKNGEETLSSFDHNLVGLSILLIGTIGLVVNSKLVFKLKKEVDANKLIFNLIFSNFAMLHAFLFPIISSFSHKWAFSHPSCVYYGSSSLIYGFNHMLSVFMLVLDMLLQKKCENYDSYKSKVRNLMIGYSWANSLFWGLAPVLGWSRISYELTNASCTVDYLNADSAYRSYILSCFGLMFAGPISIMLCCYFSADSKNVNREATNSSDKKIMVLLLQFIVVWSPYATCYLWPFFGDARQMPVKFNAVAPIVAKLSTIIPALVFLQTNNPAKKSN